MSDRHDGEDISPSSQKIKLVLKTSGHALSAASQSVSETESAAKESSSSPPRPSYSPVTPPLNSTALQSQPIPGPNEWIEEPEPVPLSLDDNVDAIALRATISLLQMQRDQSLKDIRNLDKVKQLALDDPEAFIHDLQTGKLQKPISKESSFGDVDEDDEADGETIPTNASSDFQRTERSKFGHLPDTQNVVRCPPIEWSKYHIVGEPLDQIHEMQRQHPGASLNDLTRGNPLPDGEIAAPYRPFKDTLQPDRAYSGYGS